MSFDDLPENWNDHPLTDTRLAADVVDLTLALRDRDANSILLWICDEEGYALQPIIIAEMDWFATARDRARTFSLLSQIPGATVVVAVGSRDPLPVEVVGRWQRTALVETARHHCHLLHFFEADLDEVRTPQPETLSA